MLVLPAAIKTQWVNVFRPKGDNSSHIGSTAQQYFTFIFNLLARKSSHHKSCQIAVVYLFQGDRRLWDVEGKGK